MTALIRQGNRKCDSSCYDATAPKCSCICGGKNHGVGKDKAIDNNRRLFGMKALSRYEIVSDVAGEPLIIKDVGHMDHCSVTNDAANVALDGTWHRPLTTLELLALQSFPVRFMDGSPVVLAGKSDSKWRERVGNAVPPDASRGIHEQILLAMVQHLAGETYTLGMTPVWVRRFPGNRAPKWRVS